MVRTVSHEEISSADPDALQVVEVLSSQEFERLHISGADNIPLELLNRNTTERLDPAKPVAVYCWDAY